MPMDPARAQRTPAMGLAGPLLVLTVAMAAIGCGADAGGGRATGASGTTAAASGSVTLSGPATVTPPGPATSSPPTVPRLPTPTRVALFGDSSAVTMAMGVTPPLLASRDVASLDSKADWFCELVEQAPRREGPVEKPASTNCVGWRQRWTEHLAATRPDAAVLMVGPWEVFDRKVLGQWLAFGTPEYDAVLDPTIDAAVGTLGSSGARVFVVTAPYLERLPGYGDTPPEWTPAERRRIDHLNERLRAAAERTGATVIDLAGWLCPSPTDPCTSQVNGVRLRYDGVHYDFSGLGAAVVLDWVLAQVVALPPPGTP